MRSIVTFYLIAPIEVETPSNPSSKVIWEFNGNSWTGLSVEVEHDDGAATSVIIETARLTIRDVLALVGVGRGIKPPLGTVRVRSATASPEDPSTGIAQIQGGGCVVRALLRVPTDALVGRLSGDPRIRIQAEALNAARMADDVVSRIRWAFMVLEQEQSRTGYQPSQAYRSLRNGVSHPELNDPVCKAYFQAALVVDSPDLRDPKHLAFLEKEAADLVQEASHVVESQFAGDEFWR